MSNRTTKEDTDRIKGTGTKLPKNIPISCNELLKAMLVHSDNYAAHALSRAAGISRRQFIKKMNEKPINLVCILLVFTIVQDYLAIIFPAQWI